MPRSRAAMPASTIPALYRTIERRLESVQVHSRPEVAARLLDVLEEQRVGVREIADVVRNDLPLSARILRLANAATFGQREPVTTVERASVVLGTTRLRALALSVTLDRTPGALPAQKVHKNIWRESVYRAALAAATARTVCPGHVHEAFVVGLMLDIGTPLMVRMLGKPYLDLLGAGLTPEKQFEVESRSLPFTHIDVAAVLADRWKLPRLLIEPVERHHAGVAVQPAAEASGALSAIAAYAGLVPLDPQTLAPTNPFAERARRLLKLDRSDLKRVLDVAGHEFDACRSLLDLDGRTANVDELIGKLQMRLASVLEEVVAGIDTMNEPRVFRIGSSRIEIEPSRGVRIMMYLLDTGDRRAAVYEYDTRAHTIRDVVGAFVLEPTEGDDLQSLHLHLSRFAA